VSYLERLATKATGMADEVRPRVRSRFEPAQAAADPTERAVEVSAAGGQDVPPRAVAATRNLRPGTLPTRERDAEYPARQRADTTALPRQANSTPAEREGHTFRHVAPTPSAFTGEAQRSPPTSSPEEMRAAPRPAVPDGGVTTVMSEPPLAPGGAIRTPASATRHHDSGSEPQAGMDAAARHVHVTIGRVEVRAVMPEPAARPLAPPKRPAALALDDYLRQRGQP
jgi:hypothetical protein